MAQNIYDRPDLFEGYSQLRRSPALRAMLPDVRGLRVVDLGCGFGWFCRWAREQGAAQVLGLDVSARIHLAMVSRRFVAGRVRTSGRSINKGNWRQLVRLGWDTVGEFGVGLLFTAPLASWNSRYWHKGRVSQLPHARHAGSGEFANGIGWFAGHHQPCASLCHEGGEGL